jgi:hypothetical protein
MKLAVIRPPEVFALLEMLLVFPDLATLEGFLAIDHCLELFKDLISAGCEVVM